MALETNAIFYIPTFKIIIFKSLPLNITLSKAFNPKSIEDAAYVHNKNNTLTKDLNKDIF